MRVSTAFNRILQIPGAWVETVEFTKAGIVVGLRRRQRRHICPCGLRSRARYDLSLGGGGISTWAAVPRGSKQTSPASTAAVAAGFVQNKSLGRGPEPDLPVISRT